MNAANSGMLENGFCPPPAKNQTAIRPGKIMAFATPFNANVGVRRKTHMSLRAIATSGERRVHANVLAGLAPSLLRRGD